MANNEDVNQANQGAPAADIPDLKKKEKERKKAGAAWSGAKPGGGSFSGATGGTVARSAASAASASGGAAGAAAAGAAQAAGAGWLSSMIAGLTATVLGKAILAAGVAAFLLGAGVLGYAMLKGDGAGAGGIGDLGAIASTMKVRGNDGDRTGYVASNGEIMFDPIKAAEAKKAAAEAPPAEQTAAEEVPPLPTEGASGKGSDWNRPGLENNLSGSKLSSSLGGGFGGKNIFAGNSAAPKFDAGMGKVSIQGGQKGRLSVSKNAKTGRRVAGGRAQQAKANKAFGQLKVAKGMSALGAGTATAEGARSTAGTAFDGANPGTGNVEGGPTAPTGPVSTPGSTNGAPDMTAPGVDVPDAGFVDHDKTEAINAIADMAKKAGEMEKKAKMMMIAGIALIAIGVGLLFWPMTAVGLMLIAIGAMLVAMSIMMSQMAAQMKQMADTMSEGLAAATGDVSQDRVNKYCIEKAYREGSDPKNCNPPDSVSEVEKFESDERRQVKEHDDMVRETGRVEGNNGQPTP